MSRATFHKSLKQARKMRQENGSWPRENGSEEERKLRVWLEEQCENFASLSSWKRNRFWALCSGFIKSHRHKRNRSNANVNQPASLASTTLESLPNVPVAPPVPLIPTVSYVPGSELLPANCTLQSLSDPVTKTLRGFVAIPNNQTTQQMDIEALRAVWPTSVAGQQTHVALPIVCGLARRFFGSIIVPVSQPLHQGAHMAVMSIPVVITPPMHSGNIPLHNG